MRSTSFLQAKYDDIKKVIKAAAEGPMKGFLAYTEDQVKKLNHLKFKRTRH